MVITIPTKVVRADLAISADLTSMIITLVDRWHWDIFGGSNISKMIEDRSFSQERSLFDNAIFCNFLLAKSDLLVINSTKIRMSAINQQKCCF